MTGFIVCNLNTLQSTRTMSIEQMSTNQLKLGFCPVIILEETLLLPIADPALLVSMT